MADGLERVPVPAGHPAKQDRQLRLVRLAGARTRPSRYPAALQSHTLYSAPAAAGLGRRPVVLPDRARAPMRARSGAEYLMRGLTRQLTAPQPHIRRNDANQQSRQDYQA